MVAILAILAVAGVAALGDRKAAKARGGAEVVHALFGQARNHAVLNRTNTRVVVQTKYRAAKPEDYLRAVAVFAQSGGAWTTQVTPWMRLPEGVFFSEERSGEDETGDLKAMSVGVPGGGNADCAYFEFQSNGQLSGKPTRVVVEEGVLTDGTVTSRGVEGAYGFMVYPTGQRVFMDLKKIEEEPAE